MDRLKHLFSECAYFIIKNRRNRKEKIFTQSDRTCHVAIDQPVHYFRAFCLIRQFYSNSFRFFDFSMGLRFSCIEYAPATPCHAMPCQICSQIETSNRHGHPYRLVLNDSSVSIIPQELHNKYQAQINNHNSNIVWLAIFKVKNIQVFISC